MDGGATNKEIQGRSHWAIIAALIVSDTIGSGVLALPATLANLGWIAGIFGILILGYVSLYTGQLIGRLHSIYPKFVSYADLGEEFLGKAGRIAAGTIAYVQMFGTCVVFLVGMNSFVDQVADYMGLPPVCFPLSVGIISAVALIFAQVRDLHGIGHLSCWIALPTLYLCLALLFYQLFFSGAESIHVNRTDMLPPFGLNKATVNFMNIVQTYAGHCMFFELLGSMSQPKDFNKALWSSQAIVVATYLGFSALVYSALGYDVANPFQLSLHPSIAVCIADVSMILHVLISLLIYHHIVSKGLLDGLHLSLLKKREGTFAKAHLGMLLTGSLGWAMATALVLACAWFVANLVPFFSDVMALLSSVGAINLTYGFPAAAALLQHRRYREQSSRKEPVELENGQLDLKVATAVPNSEVFHCSTIEVPLCWSIAIFSAVMMVFGVCSAVRDTIDTWASISRRPFGC
jgi:amino acid permease